MQCMYLFFVQMSYDVDLAIHGFEGIHGVAFVGDSRRVGFPKEGVGDGRAIMVSSAVA
jgi:hypothetical protein